MVSTLPIIWKQTVCPASSIALVVTHRHQRPKEEKRGRDPPQPEADLGTNTIVLRRKRQSRRPHHVYESTLHCLGILKTCPPVAAPAACTINRPCAQQYVGKSQSCMVISDGARLHERQELCNLLRTSRSGTSTTWVLIKPSSCHGSCSPRNSCS